MMRSSEFLPLLSCVFCSAAFFFSHAVLQTFIVFKLSFHFTKIWNQEKAMPWRLFALHPQTQMQRSFTPPGGNIRHQNVYITFTQREICKIFFTDCEKKLGLWLYIKKLSLMQFQ